MTQFEDSLNRKLFSDTTMADSIFSNDESEEWKAIDFNDCFEKVFGSNEASSKKSTCFLTGTYTVSSSNSTANDLKELQRKRRLEKRQLKHMRKHLTKGQHLNILISSNDMLKKERNHMLNKEAKLINRMIEYVEQVLATAL